MTVAATPTTPIPLQDAAIAFGQAVWDEVAWRLQSYAFYEQLAMLAVAVVIAAGLAWVWKRRITHDAAEAATTGKRNIRGRLASIAELIFPTLVVILFTAVAEISEARNGYLGVSRIALGLAAVYFVRSIIRRYMRDPLVINIMNYLAVPAAVLFVFGWLDEVTTYLDGLAVDLGTIKVSVYLVLRTIFFGAMLFWLGRLANVTGVRSIRNRETLDPRTKELATKFFQIGLFVVLFILLLQIVGINLTALAVFSGAVGVGLGFGLQQIASNFISGIIILLDKSLTVGDIVELEDGRIGKLRELSMRSATIETFDGKDIMVPNETFITTSFTNWTHNNKEQRYSLNFSVAYDTDLPRLFDLVRDVVASHPQVFSGDDIPIEQRPDAEIESFEDSGINILVEFWMDGVDDGVNRVGADLLLMIWQTLRDNGITIPFPQRDVRLLPEPSIKSETTTA